MTPLLPTALQINIVVPNVPWTMAKVCDALRAVNVNIGAVCITEGRPTSTIHMVVDDERQAQIALKPLGKVTTTEVMAFSVKDKPGAIAGIARVCAGAGINIRNLYSTTHGKGKTATVYIVVDDLPKAKKTFEQGKGNGW